MATQSATVHNLATAIPATPTERRAPSLAQGRYRPESASNVLKGADDFINAHEGNAPAWLTALRRNALEQVRTYGLPTPRLERWKYANLLPLGLLDLPRAPKNDTASAPAAISPLRAVFIDGHYRKDLSRLPDGVTLCGGLNDHFAALESPYTNTPADSFNDQMLWALNTLWADDGFVLVVPKRMVIEQPVEIHFHTTAAFAQSPRIIVAVEEGATATIIERHTGTKGFVNLATSITLAPSARLTHHRLQDAEAQGWIFATTHIRQARDSYYQSYSLACGNETLNRHTIWAQLQGPAAECYLNGAQLTAGEAQHETLILMNHEAPHCPSYQDYRHLTADSATGGFQGKVHVFKDAQKTAAYQMSRALLLSERAQFNTKPELEIYADDVKCSHGTTTGQMEDQAMFYLRARGLNEAEARKLLLTAFVSEAFEKLADTPDAALYGDLLAAWLDKVLKKA